MNYLGKDNSVQKLETRFLLWSYFLFGRNPTLSQRWHCKHGLSSPSVVLFASLLEIILSHFLPSKKHLLNQLLYMTCLMRECTVWVGQRHGNIFIILIPWSCYKAILEQRRTYCLGLTAVVVPTSPPEWLKLKRWTIPSANTDMEVLEVSWFPGGNAKGCGQVVGRRMAPQRYPCSSPWNLWKCYFMWQKSLCRCD